jgi:hypothetical protein
VTTRAVKERLRGLAAISIGWPMLLTALRDRRRAYRVHPEADELTDRSRERSPRLARW